jgi:hypothetical protein
MPFGVDGICQTKSANDCTLFGPYAFKLLGLDTPLDENMQ